MRSKRIFARVLRPKKDMYWTSCVHLSFRVKWPVQSGFPFSATPFCSGTTMKHPANTPVVAQSEWITTASHGGKVCFALQHTIQSWYGLD